jgi:hypothetical protein
MVLNCLNVLGRKGGGGGVEKINDRPLPVAGIGKKRAKSHTMCFLKLTSHLKRKKYLRIEFRFRHYTLEAITWFILI